MKTFILITLLLIFINLYILIFSKSISNDKLNNYNKTISFFKFSKELDNINDIEKIPKTFKILFSENNIKPAKSIEKSDIIIFNLLIDYIELYPTLNKISKQLKIFSLLCIDTFANKAKLYKTLSKNNKILSKKFLPITHIINDKDSFNNLLSTFNNDKLYILKKNIQRQKGCTITNNKDYIINSKKNDYVVCQELLQNPFLIDGHKINLRQYLIIIIEGNNCKFKLFNDGFIYYTPKKFEKDSYDKDRHITTGYIDRTIYDKHPMTIKELYHKLNSDSSTKLQNNLIELFKYISSVYSKIVIEHDSNHHLNFAVFGCDIAVGDDLSCKLMEINKGPDLSFKDERDKIVKKTLISNLLHEIKVINQPHENFITIY